MTTRSVYERLSKLLAEWFWTDRWIGSSGFLLPLEPRGLYREMLTQAWRRGGSLPNDHEAIRRAVGCTLQEWKRCWPKVEKYWRVDGDTLVNDTQLEVYAEAERLSEANSQRGKKGADARWHKRKQSPSNAQASTQASTEHVHEQYPPSPSLSPTPITQRSELSGGSRATDATRAGDFCEWYGETHDRLLKVGYIGNPRKDYEIALQLVAKFSDQEIQDAAIVWFGQRDSFATNGTRTVTKFASRASALVVQAREVAS